MAIKLDGKALAEKMRAQIRQETEMLARRPTLAVILVGEDAASQVYVRNKEKDCAECGILSQGYRLPVQTSETQLLELIDVLNKNDRVDGILVQLPLPDHISQEKVLHAIRPDKDVDAFHPFNVGKIVTGEQGFVPCTPAGVMVLLREYEIDIAGKDCVVVGRSNIVGKPMALLLLRENGTVTICHSKTAHLSEVTARADILVSAVGKTGFITGDMVKKGAVVVDVAMNRNAEGKLCGDCVFDEVEKKASYITPVPGGVGPMTRLVLMQNTLAAVKTHLQG
ncbi:MAG: bifunctional methylenetetrahydrofolate dehydrogenase/methenyltetrahydrofolate cyclohydrolase FolD [Clostridiales bacterium]|nr:bifunctional methylenetetrahydrofolate dehydrogenase/methenyltetrahydrofolate cyclohydrolase FolD [Clostridiales bacterium]MDY4037788.1 bifunctional methylenetetrahydrofolate dehydrogenase/methenyltetrahydrofolate cyclohydrolase FolD [Candidatus Pseudoscilispira sp.]